MNNIRKACVYCASSSHIDKEYIDAATELGRLMAQHDIGLVYGGGYIGLMGAVSDSIKANGGKATGVIPHFMVERNWLRKGLDEVIETETMSERKHIMSELGDAAIVLPGGLGTFDELMDIMSLKKLGLYLKPIVILNTKDYYAPLISMIERSMADNFLSQHYRGCLMQVASTPNEAIDMVLGAPTCDKSIIDYAAI